MLFYIDLHSNKIFIFFNLITPINQIKSQSYRKQNSLLYLTHDKISFQKDNKNNFYNKNNILISINILNHIKV